MKISDSLIRSDIQNYLNQLQDVITRMAENSKMCKQTSIVLLTAWIAFMGVVFQNNISLNFIFKIICIIPLIFLTLLDAWYLLFERKFRNKFNSYVEIYTSNIKLDPMGEVPIDLKLIERLYNLSPETEDAYKKNTCFCSVLFSRSVIWFYLIEIAVALAVAFSKGV